MLDLPICPLQYLYKAGGGLVVLLAQLVGPFWRVAVTLGALMVPAWDNGDIRPCAVAPALLCNIAMFSCSKSMGISGHCIALLCHCIELFKVVGDVRNEMVPSSTK